MRAFPSLGLDQLLASSRLFYLAEEVLREEYEALSEARDRAERHAAFQAEADAFRWEKGG